jgi:hypothetical protein
MHRDFSRVNQFIAFLGLFLFAVQYAFAQGSVVSMQTAEQIAAKVDEYMNAAVKVDDFSGSVLVARDGTTDFQ